MRQNNQEGRVLIFAPVGQDAEAMSGALNERGVSSQICQSLTECCDLIILEADALVLTEEALDGPTVQDLLNVLKSQPPWSELPIIILTSGGESRLNRLLSLTESAAGSVTLLERPMSISTLWRSVQVAMRSRRRQYLIRDLLAEQLHKRAELEQAEETLRRAKDFDDAVMNNMGEGLVTVDNEGIVTSINLAGEKILGWKINELRGRKMHDVVHFKHRDGSPFPAEECAAMNVLDEGCTLVDQEDVFICKDGAFIDVVYSSSPIRERGKIIGLVVVFRDNTERLRGTEAKRKLAAIVEYSEDAIISKDLNGVILSWNRGAEHLFGYNSSEAIGKPVTILIPEDRLHEEPRILARLRVGESVQHYETVRRRKDGTLLNISLTVSPMRDQAGNVVAISKIARDITSRIHVEESLRQTQAELQKYATNLEKLVAERTEVLRSTNEQLEEFVYSVAHDLRAPLRSMIGYSQLLLSDHVHALDNTGQRMLKRIQVSSEFMDRLILDLLAYGRAARADVELGRVEVAKAWEAALAQCSSQIEQSAAKIDTLEPLPVVRAHEATLGQVLANLLNNALKFMPPGVHPHIRFGAEERTAFVRLWIEDNGIGIPPDQHERIFRVFERLERSQYPGTGIGLSIVRKGVERMGGSVGLNSTPGQGSQFWVDLVKAN